MSPPRAACAAGGFTLVEVLVALSIVAITLGAGLKAAGALIDNVQRFADVTQAQWCADNQLANMRLTRFFPGIGDQDFSCQQLGRTFAGRLVVRPTPNPNFRRVDAHVLDAEGRTIIRLSAIMARY